MIIHILFLLETANDAMIIFHKIEFNTLPQQHNQFSQ